MGQSSTTFGVTKDHAIPIEPPLGGSALVQNLSGATLNVADDSQMSVDVNTITVGNSATFTSPQFMKSQGALSSVLVTFTTATGAGNSAQLTGNSGDDTKAISAGTGIKLPAALLTGSVGDDGKAISAGTGIAIQPATLSGNPADDVFAVSAGTAQHLSLSGGSPAASLAANVRANIFTFGPGGVNAPDGSYTLINTTTKKLGDGSSTALSAVYSTLAAAQAVYPFATALTQKVAYCALQLAVNTLVPLTNPVGATLLMPRGLYEMGGDIVTVPAASSTLATFTIEGVNGTIAEPDYTGASMIEWTTDVTGAPHFTYGIDASAHQGFTLKNIALKGPNVFPFAGGGHANIPAVLGGVRVGSRSFINNCSFSGFSTAVGYGGGTIGGFSANVGFDHSQIDGIWTNNCAYAINLLPGSNSAGDQHWYRVYVDANCAAIAIATSASSGLVGSSITGAGCYAPVGMYLYDDFPTTGTHGGAQILGNVWNLLSFEQSYNGAVQCQRLANPGASIFAKNHIAYMFQGPNVSLTGWGWNAVVVTSAPAGATGNQIQFTDGHGANWQLGMVVTDTTNPGRIPAGTTVTAIAGSWPYAAPVMTLSNNLTADPTGDTLTIAMPKVGHILSATIRDNVATTFASAGNFPVYWVPNTAAGKCNDNACFATTEPIGGALGHALTSGAAYATTWGNPNGTVIGSGQMSPGVSCTAGDLLMLDGTGSLLVLCDNTRPPVGAAVLTTSAGGNVDYYIRAVNPNLATVRNRTAGTIAANALLKVDAANPGGVTTSTGSSDGFVVGCNNNTTITAGTSGTIAHLKCW